MNAGERTKMVRSLGRLNKAALISSILQQHTVKEQELNAQTAVFFGNLARFTEHTNAEREKVVQQRDACEFRLAARDSEEVEQLIGVPFRLQEKELEEARVQVRGADECVRRLERELRLLTEKYRDATLLERIKFLFKRF